MPTGLMHKPQLRRPRSLLSRDPSFRRQSGGEGGLLHTLGGIGRHVYWGGIVKERSNYHAENPFRRITWWDKVLDFLTSGSHIHHKMNKANVWEQARANQERAAAAQ